MHRRRNDNEQTDLMKWICARTTTMSERIIWLFVHAHAYHTCHGPKAVMMREIGMHHGTMSNGIRRLIKNGLLEKKEAPTPGQYYYIAKIPA